MVGGDPDAFERCRPVFESFAGFVRHMGPVGAGQLTKAVNNLVFIANLGVVADALKLGAELGLDPASLAEVMRAGSASSFALGLYAPALSLTPFAPVAALLRKDLDILLDVARAAGLDVSSLGSAAEHTVRMLTRGNEGLRAR
jgi:3-hydroxyisobutyrate dehydrogenase-like beta-hydroxyacid dehydrogenase